MNIQQLQKLQDLIATQNLATSTYMATQTAKDQKINTDWDNYKTELLKPRSSTVVNDSPKSEYKKWNLY